MVKKVVLMNGPKNWGKDTAADYIVKNDPRFRKMEFKESLTELTRRFFCLHEKVWQAMLQRQYKETSYVQLGGRTPRQALIFVSEEVIKPVFGKDVFGRLARRKIDEAPEEFFVFSDSGFIEEALPVAEGHTPEDFLVIRILVPDSSAVNDDGSFSGDSRRYLKPEELPNATFVDIHNDDTLDKFLENVYSVVSKFVNGSE